MLTNVYLKGKPIDSPVIKGYDFNQGVNYPLLFKSYQNMGLQATNFAKAINILKKVIQEKKQLKDQSKIFLGYTSNMISSGIRDIIRYLAEHKKIDCIVTSAGGIEEDFIKCLSTFHQGSFQMDDVENRKNALNRIGNILVPSQNYIKFEQFLNPILQQMWKFQEEQKFVWSPSTFIDKLGQKINNPQSIYYWCHKNNIPVFCPALTDGAIGDMIFSFSYKRENFKIDIVADICKINKLAMFAKKSAVLVLGGGIVKHHILNANIWRNGADYGVFINTGIYQDGSDSGAKISEAQSWGKLSLQSQFTKVYGQASLIFPVLVAQTFCSNE